jgi:hypothetical protein
MLFLATLKLPKVDAIFSYCKIVKLPNVDPILSYCKIILY